MWMWTWINECEEVDEDNNNNIANANGIDIGGKKTHPAHRSSATSLWWEWVWVAGIISHYTCAAVQSKATKYNHLFIWTRKLNLVQ